MTSSLWRDEQFSIASRGRPTQRLDIGTSCYRSHSADGRPQYSYQSTDTRVRRRHSPERRSIPMHPTRFRYNLPASEPIYHDIEQERLQSRSLSPERRHDASPLDEGFSYKIPVSRTQSQISQNNSQPPSEQDMAESSWIVFGNAFADNGSVSTGWSEKELLQRFKKSREAEKTKKGKSRYGRKKKKEARILNMPSTLKRISESPSKVPPPVSPLTKRRQYIRGADEHPEEVEPSPRMKRKGLMARMHVEKSPDVAAPETRCGPPKWKILPSFSKSNEEVESTHSSHGSSGLDSGTFPEVDNEVSYASFSVEDSEPRESPTAFQNLREMETSEDSQDDIDIAQMTLSDGAAFSRIGAFPTLSEHYAKHDDQVGTCDVFETETLDLSLGKDGSNQEWVGKAESQHRFATNDLESSGDSTGLKEVPESETYTSHDEWQRSREGQGTTFVSPELDCTSSTHVAGGGVAVKDSSGVKVNESPISVIGLQHGETEVAADMSARDAPPTEPKHKTYPKSSYPKSILRSSRSSAGYPLNAPYDEKYRTSRVSFGEHRITHFSPFTQPMVSYTSPDAVETPYDEQHRMNGAAFPEQRIDHSEPGDYHSKHFAARTMNSERDQARNAQLDMQLEREISSVRRGNGSMLRFPRTESQNSEGCGAFPTQPPVSFPVSAARQNESQEDPALEGPNFSRSLDLDCRELKRLDYEQGIARSGGSVELDDSFSDGFDFIEAVGAVVIQTAVRRYLAKLEIERVRVEYSDQDLREQFEEMAIHMFDLAAIQIQSVFRGWWVRDCLSVDHYCATRIQKVLRGYICRMNFLFDVYRIILVQSIWRRTRAMHTTVLRIANIVAMQSVYRGYATRRRLGLIRTRAAQRSLENKAATTIQARWRMFDTQMYYLSDLACILIVQSVARRWIAQTRIVPYLKARPLGNSDCFVLDEYSRSREERKCTEAMQIHQHLYVGEHREASTVPPSGSKEVHSDGSGAQVVKDRRTDPIDQREELITLRMVKEWQEQDNGESGGEDKGLTQDRIDQREELITVDIEGKWQRQEDEKSQRSSKTTNSCRKQSPSSGTSLGQGERPHQVVERTKLPRGYAVVRIEESWSWQYSTLEPEETASDSTFTVGESSIDHSQTDVLGEPAGHKADTTAGIEVGGLLVDSPASTSSPVGIGSGLSDLEQEADPRLEIRAPKPADQLDGTLRLHSDPRKVEVVKLADIVAAQRNRENEVSKMSGVAANFWRNMAKSSDRKDSSSHTAIKGHTRNDEEAEISGQNCHLSVANGEENTTRKLQTLSSTERTQQVQDDHLGNLRAPTTDSSPVPMLELRNASSGTPNLLGSEENLLVNSGPRAPFVAQTNEGSQISDFSTRLGASLDVTKDSFLPDFGSSGSVDVKKNSGSMNVVASNDTHAEEERRPKLEMVKVWQQREASAQCCDTKKPEDSVAISRNHRSVEQFRFPAEKSTPSVLSTPTEPSVEQSTTKQDASEHVIEADLSESPSVLPKRESPGEASSYSEVTKLEDMALVENYHEKRMRSLLEVSGGSPERNQVGPSETGRDGYEILDSSGAKNKRESETASMSGEAANFWKNLAKVNSSMPSHSRRELATNSHDEAQHSTSHSTVHSGRDDDDAKTGETGQGSPQLESRHRESCETLDKIQAKKEDLDDSDGVHGSSQVAPESSIAAQTLVSSELTLDKISDHSSGMGQGHLPGKVAEQEGHEGIKVQNVQGLSAREKMLERLRQVKEWQQSLDMK